MSVIMSNNRKNVLDLLLAFIIMHVKKMYNDLYGMDKQVKTKCSMQQKYFCKFSAVFSPPVPSTLRSSKFSMPTFSVYPVRFAEKGQTVNVHNKSHSQPFKSTHTHKHIGALLHQIHLI